MFVKLKNETISFARQKLYSSVYIIYMKTTFYNQTLANVIFVNTPCNG
jgi:hypothetical protein